MHWIKYFVDRVDRRMTATEYAKRIGTYNSPDRSRQYPLNDPDQLRDAVHKCWVKVHALEAANKELEASGTLKDEEIEILKTRVGRYRLKYLALSSILTGLAWEGIRALIPVLSHFFQ